MSKLECPLYNKGLYIEKVNHTDAYVSMCCFQKLSPTTYTTIDFINNDYLKSIRENTNNPVECVGCILSEKSGNQSYRQGQLSAFKLQNLKTDNVAELLSFSYNCENTCNLKCITCGPKFSSAWKPDYKKLGYPIREHSVKTAGHKNRLYEGLDLSRVKLLHFQGGEPLLTEDHKNILSQIKHLNETIVGYNTNGTIFPEQAVIELWKQTKLTKLYFSIDATGDQFEYIRYSANWKQVSDNLMRINNLGIPNLWIELGVTVSIANLFYLQDIIDWRDRYFSMLTTGDKINIFLNIAGPLSYGGQVLCLSNLNNKLKDRALDYLNTITDDSVSKPIIEQVNLANSTKTDWITYLDQLDQIRNTNWKKSLSKLYAATI